MTDAKMIEARNQLALQIEQLVAAQKAGHRVALEAMLSLVATIALTHPCCTGDVAEGLLRLGAKLALLETTGSGNQAAAAAPLPAASGPSLH